MFNNDKLLMAVVMSLQFRGGATAFCQSGQDFASGGGGGARHANEGTFPFTYDKGRTEWTESGLTSATYTYSP